MSNNFSESFVHREFIQPYSWDYNYNLTYLNFNKLFKYMDENNLQNKDIIPVLKLLYNRDILRGRFKDILNEMSMMWSI